MESEFAWSPSRQRPSSSTPFLRGLQGFDAGGRLMHRNSGERHCIMRHARSIHRHGSFNSRCSLPLSPWSFSLCFCRYFAMHRVHYRKPYDSVLAENCQYLNLGMVYCLFYAGIACIDNVPESLEFFFLCVYRTYKRASTIQLVHQRKPYSSVLTEKYRYFEISKWCIDDLMIPYVDRQCSCTSGMNFCVFPAFFTCLHDAS